MTRPNPPIGSGAFFVRLWLLNQMAVDAFEVKHPLLRAIVWLLSLPGALWMMYLNYQYERRVHADNSVNRASAWLLARFTNQVNASHLERVPLDKPLLLVCNHAGMGDAIAVHSSLPRHDVDTMVFRQGLLLGLPNFTEYCVVIDKQNPSGALREAVRRLKSGRTLLLFPRGEIETDPALDIHAAQETLCEWSDSIAFLARHVPNLAVLPVAVGGVISRQALNLPISRLYKTLPRRTFVAATFQLMLPIFHDPIVQVRYGEPLGGAQVTSTAIVDQMQSLLQQVHSEQHHLVETGKLAVILPAYRNT